MRLRLGTFWSPREAMWVYPVGVRRRYVRPGTRAVLDVVGGRLCWLSIGTCRFTLHIEALRRGWACLGTSYLTLAVVPSDDP